MERLYGRFSNPKRLENGEKTVSKFIFFNLYAAFFNLFAAFYNLFETFFNLSLSLFNLLAGFFNLFASFINLFAAFIDLSAALLNLFVLFFSERSSKFGRNTDWSSSRIVKTA